MFVPNEWLGRAGRCTIHSLPAFAHRAQGGSSDPMHFIWSVSQFSDHGFGFYLQPATARTGELSDWPRSWHTGGSHGVDASRWPVGIERSEGNAPDRCKVRLPRLLVTICNQATRPVFRGYNSLMKAMRRHFQASITSGLSHHVSISPDGPVRNIKENSFRVL